jgi:hypothetical protein
MRHSSPKNGRLYKNFSANNNAQQEEQEDDDDENII